MKFDITIAVPGLPFNGETIHKQSLGGSESAGYFLARALAKLGHNVTAFTNTDAPGDSDGVLYLPMERWAPYVSGTPHDLCIIQRAPQMLTNRVNARLVYLWQHDLALKRSENDIKSVAAVIDRVMVLSKFMKEQYSEVYALPDSLLTQTRNGVDLELVEAAKAELAIAAASLDAAQAASAQRKPKRLVYMARPERGLDVLLESIFPKLLEKDPELELALCSYSNPVDTLAPFYALCEHLAASFGPRVRQHGHLTKVELYKLLLTSGVYTYPTPSPSNAMFAEVSCIAVMEAQACGLPVVASDCGALVETLAGGAGTLITGKPGDDQHDDSFVRAVLSYTTDERKWKRASKKGGERAQELSWDGVAKDWAELIEADLRERSSDVGSLGMHFYKRSDIVPLRALIAVEGTTHPGLLKLSKILDDKYAFMVEPDGYKKQYETIGATHDARVLEMSPREKRFEVLRDFLKSEPAIRTVLDYGCAHGAYATNLAAQLPNISIMGVDIDHFSVEMARSFAEKLSVTGRAAFETLTHDALPFADKFHDEVLLDSEHRLWDCAVAQEVLEHVPEPWKVIEALESRVREDGWVYLTVPLGPWEYTSYDPYPHRCHIWEFDVHDLRDMLKGKTGVRMAALPSGISPELGDMLGWWIIRWQVKDAERGAKPIDMERKLWLQAPRQSVSATLIAGAGAEDTLHWCLKALRHTADQLVIVDTGLNDEGKRIIAQYADVELIPGADPRTEGFETPRNAGLERCWGEWILWVDTDEKLMDTHRIGKYLRHNIFDGYSIKQHHFAVDTEFTPDMPIRLFRRSTGCRWYGMIHEHPERGINLGVGLTATLADVHIAHVGYLIETGRKQKFMRNLPMLKKDMEKYPTRLLQKVFVMRENMTQVVFTLQNNGKMMTPELQNICRQVIAMYRENFIDKSLVLSTDPIVYYSQALELLGEGFSVAMQLSAAKTNAPVNGVERLRFANQEDFLAVLASRAKDITAPFTSAYF